MLMTEAMAMATSEVLLSPKARSMEANILYAANTGMPAKRMIRYSAESSSMFCGVFKSKSMGRARHRESTVIAAAITTVKR